MKFQTILSKVNDILKHPKRRGKKKLYRQWVDTAGLPPEAIPKEEVAGDIIPKTDKNKLRLNVLYILLAASIMILCMGVVLLIMYSC